MIKSNKKIDVDKNKVNDLSFKFYKMTKGLSYLEFLVIIIMLIDRIDQQYSEQHNMKKNKFKNMLINSLKGDKNE